MVRVHVIGSGVAGLAAAARALQLGADVRLYEGRSDVGGRLRDLTDPVSGIAASGAWPVIQGSDAAVRGLIDLVGAADRWRAISPVIHVSEDTGASRWTVQPGHGKSQAFRRSARPPGTTPWQYLELLKLRFADPDETVEQMLRHAGESLPRWWTPLCRLLLNTPDTEAAPRLFWHELTQCLFSGHAPFALAPEHGLEDGLVRPALAWLAQEGIRLRLGRQLTDLELEDRTVKRLFFGPEQEPVDEAQGVILALPPRRVADILPEYGIAPRMNASVIVHFDLDIDQPQASLIATVKGSHIWGLHQGNRLTVLIPSARPVIGWTREDIAALAWREAAPILDADPNSVPKNFVLKNRRATIAHTPGTEQSRSGLETGFGNLMVANGANLLGRADRFDSSAAAGAMAAEQLVERLSAKA